MVSSLRRDQFDPDAVFVANACSSACARIRSRATRDVIYVQELDLLRVGGEPQMRSPTRSPTTQSPPYTAPSVRSQLKLCACTNATLSIGTAVRCPSGCSPMTLSAVTCPLSRSTVRPSDLTSLAFAGRSRAELSACATGV